MRKDQEEMLRQLGRDGYTVTRSPGSGHWHVRDAAGRLLAVASSTPSDPRSMANLRSQMARAKAKLINRAALRVY